MIKVILVDDEQPALDELQYLLKDASDIEITGLFTSPNKALEYILLHDVDALFLDISMPEMDGFLLAEALIRLRKPPIIIFATAFDEYAIKAFEVNAIDYLLKPITEDRLTITLKRLRDSMVSTPKPDNLKQLLKDRYIDRRTTRIPLWKNDRIHLLSPHDIAYLESKDKETYLYTKKGLFISSESLSHYEEILHDYSFFRCHRSYMIHLDAIKEIIPWFNNTFAVKLNDYEIDIPISRRNVKDFKDLMNL